MAQPGRGGALRWPLDGETVALEDAAGRVTAEPIWAAISSPHYHASAMDGYAVSAERTWGASETRPVRLKVGEEASYVDTGDPLPPGMNAVIMVEHIQQGRARAEIEIMASVAPWHHVRAMGEDIVATELVPRAASCFAPVDLGAVAACGLTEVAVRRKPKVAVLPTGSELVEPGSEVEPGRHHRLQLADAGRDGARVGRGNAAANACGRLRGHSRPGAASGRSDDLVIVDAGSSAGSEDFTARIVQELGHLLVHGIAIRPGHPVILGLICLPGRTDRRRGEGGFTTNA